MSNDIVGRDENVPAWMKQKSTGAVLGNLSAEDDEAARGKIASGDVARSVLNSNWGFNFLGEFWLTGRNLNLGARTSPATPIILKKTYVLWNPTKSMESRVPLAVASDGIRWDIPNQEFTVYFPNNRTPYVWKTMRTVAEIAARSRFGSSQPDNPKSTPAASMTYQMLWAFRLPDGRPQLGVITNSRTGIKPMKELFGMIDGYKPDRSLLPALPGSRQCGFSAFARASTSLATSISRRASLAMTRRLWATITRRSMTASRKQRASRPRWLTRPILRPSRRTIPTLTSAAPSDDDEDSLLMDARDYARVYGDSDLKPVHH